MINCIAVDDEPLALSLLADNISKIPFLRICAMCDSAVSANVALQGDEIDLIFIDVQMPGISGIQFIKSLVKQPMVIIVSAYNQYALDGFELDVVDYLVKPVPMERFMKACNKAKELFDLKSLKQTVNTPLLTYTFLNAGYSMVKVVFDEVLYIEGLRDYVKINFVDGRKPAVVRLSFKALEQNWPSYFMRIHKSFIVNTKQIHTVTKTAIVMGEQELPLGEAFRQSITRMIETAN